MPEKRALRRGKPDLSPGRLISWIGCVLTVSSLCGFLILYKFYVDPDNPNWHDQLDAWAGWIACAAVIGFPLLILGIIVLALEGKAPRPEHGSGSTGRNRASDGSGSTPTTTR